MDNPKIANNKEIGTKQQKNPVKIMVFKIWEYF